MKADINSGPLLCYVIFTLIKISKNLNFCHLLCLLPNNTISLLWTLARFIHFSQMVTHTNQCLSLCSHLPFHTTVVFGLVACCLPEMFPSSHFSTGSRLFSVFCTTRFVSDHVFFYLPSLMRSANLWVSAHICFTSSHRVFRHVNFSDALPSQLYIIHFYTQVYSQLINKFPRSWQW